MARRTKIIATIGPASESPERLRGLVEAGIDVARLGLAHGTLEEALGRYHRIRAAAAEVGREVGILCDLPGPKVRAGQFPEPARLAEGQLIRIQPGTGTSSADVIEVDYDHLLEDIRPGDRVAFGDGGVVVEVEDVGGDALKGRVAYGGLLQGRPGLHIPSHRLRLSSPTATDLRLLDAFVEAGVDMVAISFVRSAHDVRRVGTEPHPRGPVVVAKIETRAAVDNLEGIIEAAGAVMVARGDLGAECPIEELPHLQKRIIRDCIAGGRPVITATQMLESMVTAPSPTRAEASDVANAVFDGSSALMLSAETAVGHDPVNVVRTMARIAKRADEEFDYAGWASNLQRLRRRAAGDGPVKVTDAMTGAAWRAATELDVSAVICVSESGFTVRAIARFRPEMPIIGFSPNDRTVRQLCLSWGVEPMHSPEWGDRSAIAERLVVLARDAGHVRSGDLVAVLAGAGPQSRATDTLRMLRVP